MAVSSILRISALMRNIYQAIAIRWIVDSLIESNAFVETDLLVYGNNGALADKNVDSDNPSAGPASVNHLTYIPEISTNQIVQSLIEGSKNAAENSGQLEESV